MRAMLASVFLFTATNAYAALNPSMQSRLASLVNEGEGTAVSEALLARGDHPGTDIEKKLRNIARAAEHDLDESVRNADWNDAHFGIDGPACFDGAPKFGLLLRALHLPGYVAASGSHVFLIAQTADAALLIDPTIHQYFGQDSAPDWVPRIFVGTLSELRALYEREPGLPLLPFEKIYFDPEWPASRKDSKMLGQRDRLLSRQSDAEYAPLVRFLNAAGLGGE
jgi:hypothetical protein